LLVNALLIILFLSDTHGGRMHDKRIADATPYPLPAGSRLLQDLGFLAFTLPEVVILMPTKKPRGQELTREHQRANQALNQRRLRIEHVNSSVRIGKSNGIFAPVSAGAPRRSSHRPDAVSPRCPAALAYARVGSLAWSGSTSHGGCSAYSFPCLFAYLIFTEVWP
jgi:hypothetical protein